MVFIICIHSQDTLDGRAILKQGKADKGLLREGSRRKLTRLIIHEILENNPGYKISTDQFKNLAAEVVEIFPRESELVYYSGYESGKDNIAKKNASGKLYESYVNRRRQLRESGELAGHTRSISRSSCTTSTTTHSTSPTTLSFEDNTDYGKHRKTEKATGHACMTRQSLVDSF